MRLISKVSYALRLIGSDVWQQSPTTVLSPRNCSHSVLIFSFMWFFPLQAVTAHHLAYIDHGLCCLYLLTGQTCRGFIKRLSTSLSPPVAVGGPNHLKQPPQGTGCPDNALVVNTKDLMMVYWLRTVLNWRQTGYFAYLDLCLEFYSKWRIF